MSSGTWGLVIPYSLFVDQINSLVCDGQRIAVKRVNPFLLVKEQIQLIVIIRSSYIL